MEIQKIHFIRINVNKDTGEETHLTDELYADQIQCLYKDRKGVYISTKQGYLIKVNHTIEELEGALGL